MGKEKSQANNFKESSRELETDYAIKCITRRFA